MFPAAASHPVVPIRASREAWRQSAAAAEEGLERLRGDRVALHHALQEVRWASHQFGARLPAIRADFVRDTRSLSQALDSIWNLDGDRMLRLKGERIKPLQSGSAWKNLLGHGEAKRTAQAEALARRYAGAATRNDLIALRDRVMADDAVAIQKCLDEDDRMLGRAVRQAMIFADPPERRHRPDQACVPLMPDIGESPHSMTEGPGQSSPPAVQGCLELLCHHVSDAHQHWSSIRQRELTVERDNAHAALRELDRKERVQHRAPLVAALVPLDQERRSSRVNRLQADLQQRLDGESFAMVWASRRGREAVQGMCRGLCSRTRALTIKEQIVRTQGRDTFRHDEGRIRAGINLMLYAEMLHPGTVNEIADINRELALIRYSQGVEPETTYYQATCTTEELERLGTMIATGAPVRPQAFFSTAPSVEDAGNSTAVEGAGSQAVWFRISGFSGMSLHSRYVDDRVRGEKIYTHRCLFTVASVISHDGRYVVGLQEVPASPQQLLRAAPLIL
ncbi:hypothetical protein [Stenotrophomonas maltophilia]